MNREKKTLFQKTVFRIGVMFLVLAASRAAYIFIYRGKTEPPTKRVLTNRDPAVYTLEEQIERLSRKDELMAVAFEDREKEKDYGTYVIPGLKTTRTFQTSEGDVPAMCTSMTPQGLAVTEDYILISAYCHTETHNSVIYVLDKESHRFIKEVVLPGQPHVGGLAYDSDHGLLWYSSNTAELAQAVSISMETLEAYDYSESGRPVPVNQVCSLYGIVRDSFMTFYDGCLYVGCFMKASESVIARYPVDGEGKLIDTMDEGLGMNFQMAVPLDYSTISEQAQGMAFYEDRLLLSHSYGILPSRLVFYQRSDERLYVDENSARSYYFPERMEQIVVEGDNLYVLFESGAYAYSASSRNIVDRVLRFSLPKIEEYEIRMEESGY